ncbi:hypothetical protein DEO72_LG8g2147 [Vigna unguiculata]|uniref:Uncharacterized protein n=1 Tax=Vigna unguiculata TaxID=3917 RepID=A0A4D6MTL1_VIGUN|nr:hypothetical protein DEO72_LG8g2147 [Vigna unguiculata]
MVKGWRGWKTFLDVQERVKEAFGLKIHQEFVKPPGGHACATRRFIHLCAILTFVNLNRLAGMNIRQAARQCSWSLAVFVAALLRRLEALGLLPGDSESRGCALKFWQLCTGLSGRPATRSECETLSPWRGCDTLKGGIKENLNEWIDRGKVQRYTDTRQAMYLTGERTVLRCVWRHVELRQAVTRKQGH